MALVIGVGFRAATTGRDLYAAMASAIAAVGKSWQEVAVVATTSRRVGHVALEGLTVPVEVHDPASLARIDTPGRSAAVAALAGTASVAEAAALASSLGGTLLAPKRCAAGICTAVSRRPEMKVSP